MPLSTFSNTNFLKIGMIFLYVSFNIFIDKLPFEFLQVQFNMCCGTGIVAKLK